METGSLHIVMLPWLAVGHLLPFLELSKRIAHKGHHISFLSTPRNIQRLPKLPPNLSSLINFIELPLPSTEHLPENAEATIDLPSYDLAPYLRKAYDTFERELSSYVQSSSPDWIIYDYAAYWVPRVAAEHRVPCALLSLFGAAVLGFIGPPTALMGMRDSWKEPKDLTVVPKWVPFPSTLAFLCHEAEAFFKHGVLPDSSGVSESYRFGASIEGCDVVAVRSCTELEPEWLRILEDLYKKPVIPIGLSPPLHQEGGREEDEKKESKWSSTFEWLDKQAPGSVVYAAFGSEAKLSSLDVHEIALGLELSQLPFVLALRAPEHSLPEGFEGPNEGRGAVCLGWVPQVRFLAHPSVGGFLTHAGWNSIIEGLRFGLAMVLLPLMFDQSLNARYMVEKRIGAEVARDEDGTFSRDGIAGTLRLVMVEEEGKPLRSKAREFREAFGDEETHDKYVSKFLSYLWEHRKQQNP